MHRLLVLLFCLMLSSSCSAQASRQMDSSDLFTPSDLSGEFDPSSAVSVSLTGASAVCDDPSVIIDGGRITITGAGAYRLCGTLDDGVIVVDCGKKDEVQLILDGVSIRSADSAAIHIRKADHVYVTLAEGSVNTLSNGGRFVPIDEHDAEAVLYSRDDLTVNGSGTLRIVSPAGHGIDAKDDLILAGAALKIEADGHGVTANDSIRVSGASLSIISGKDGLHAENDDDDTLGFVYAADGTFDIVSDGDGVSASSDLLIGGGAWRIVSGGGSRSQGRDGSCKALKSDSDVAVTGGSFSLDAYDDGLHAGGSITVSGGSLHITTGDDALHADRDLTVTGGTVIVSDSREGLEGHTVKITGGTVSVVSADDGVNAAGGADQSGGSFASPDAGHIIISGGTVTIHAEGDGIDANGSIFISGGVTTIAGPTGRGNSAVDYDDTAVITGGTLIACDDSDRPQHVGAESTQGAMLLFVRQQPSGTPVSLVDPSGTELLSFVSAKPFGSVLISCPALTQGETYTVRVGDEAISVTLDPLIYPADYGRRR